MSQKEGEWIKPRKKNEFSQEGKEAVRPQQEKIKEAGKLIKERCAGKKGEDFWECRRKIFGELFPKKKPNKD
jgi:hypothetical protein